MLTTPGALRDRARRARRTSAASRTAACREQPGGHDGDRRSSGVLLDQRHEQAGRGGPYRRVAAQVPPPRAITTSPARSRAAPGRPARRGSRASSGGSVQSAASDARTRPRRGQAPGRLGRATQLRTVGRLGVGDGQRRRGRLPRASAPVRGASGRSTSPPTSRMITPWMMVARLLASSGEKRRSRCCSRPSGARRTAGPRAPRRRRCCGRAARRRCRVKPASTTGRLVVRIWNEPPQHVAGAGEARRTRRRSPSPA